MRKISLATVLLGLGLTVCQVAVGQEAESDVALSWEKGVAHVPGKLFQTSPASVVTEKRLPVVLYMHGCTGIGRNDKFWAGFLKDLGYIVIQPASLMRDRPKSCDPVARKGGLFPGIWTLRHQEVNYARDQIEKSLWADTTKVFLMGHSEGGVTVSQVGRRDFKGVIISGWHCQWGLQTALAVPVLTLNFETDPWYRHSSGKDCEFRFGSRMHAHMLSIEGNDHDTYVQPAREALAHFLSTYADYTPPAD